MVVFINCFSNTRYIMDNNNSNPTDNNNNQTDSSGGTSIDGVSRPNLADSESTSSSFTEPPSTPTPEESPSPTSSSPPTSTSSNTPLKPVTMSSFSKRRSRLWSFLLGLVVIAIFVGGIYEVYEWQHKQVLSLDSQVQTLQNSVNSLNKKLSGTKTTVSITTAPSTTSSTTSTTTTFQIPELGIEFSVPYIISDITYAANSTKTSVNLSTQTLTDLDSGCTPSATGTLALGNIYKTTGQFKTTTGVTLIKQYPTYYISFTEPTGPCSKVTQVASLTTTLETSLKSSFASIELSQ